MAGDSTFTSLLNETLGNNGQEWNGLGSPPEEQQDTPFYTTPSTQGSKKARNKNFCESEDVVLVRAWLGTKKSAFWTRVHNFYHSEKEIIVHHSSNSLSHRWSTTQESVNKFCGCFTAIEGRNQSGKTFENKLMDACILYKEEDKEKKSFQLLHCWNILRHEPKWHQKLSQMAEIKYSQKKNKALDDSILDLTGNKNDDLPNASNNDIATPEGDAPKRPMGRKKAKQLLHRGGGDACIEALDQMWEKKKKADAEKEAKKEERCSQILSFKNFNNRYDKPSHTLDSCTFSNTNVLICAIRRYSIT
ncbi:hypothetical protein GQ55_1G122400 [Panicum hallii var. hallii]|uniref:No apical meristem-associated C-terminal domain-containing protein n=1 Tax=Panicum hallii var. hallii TaxID=1504633 RepID=A0A2T7F4Y1_9POAL|nr:hypothetical protein GQ55_1G122400 [Panicum hallii var. hallii]